MRAKVMSIAMPSSSLSRLVYDVRMRKMSEMKELLPWSKLSVRAARNRNSNPLGKDACQIAYTGRPFAFDVYGKAVEFVCRRREKIYVCDVFDTTTIARPTTVFADN